MLSHLLLLEFYNDFLEKKHILCSLMSFWDGLMVLLKLKQWKCLENTRVDWRCWCSFHSTCQEAWGFQCTGHFLWSRELHISEFTVLFEYLRQKVFRVCINYFQIQRFFRVPLVQFESATSSLFGKDFGKGVPGCQELLNVTREIFISLMSA